jgi:hypothetical protein
MSANLTAAWAEVLNHPKLPAIKSSLKRRTVAQLLTNFKNESAKTRRSVVSESISGQLGASTSTGNLSTFDPLLLTLVRRATPNLIAFDIASTQAIDKPSSLIFCQRAVKKVPQADGTFQNKEAFWAESGGNPINPRFSGLNPDSESGVPGLPTLLG